jgi:hypothetical protein
MAPVRGGRSADRTTFCKEVNQRARLIAQEYIDQHDFRACFNSIRKSAIRYALKDHKAIARLRSTLKELKGTLQSFLHNCDQDPLLVVAFDEVSSLLDKEGSGRWIALNRIISCISEERIWYFFLSTHSKLDQVLPPDNAPRNKAAPHQPSYRGENTLERYPPFSMFTIDIPDYARNFRFTPENESMSEFTSAEYMKQFGRPLWLAYPRPDIIAAQKIIGASQSFNHSNTDHVFAILSVRLCLDINLANVRAVSLAQTAVNIHMRMVESVDPSLGIMYTRTPSEPILAKAAMRYLCEGSQWMLSLRTFNEALLDGGTITKGPKGELFSRLILTLAHDSIVGGGNAVGGSFNNVLPTFTVQQFLKALYSTPYHTVIDIIDKDILEARMNFLSFISTEEFLVPDILQPLCYQLLRRCTALQLAPGQKSYDKLLPFYYGDPNKPFDLTKVGAIMVQDKNRGRASKPSQLLDEDFFPISGPEPRQTPLRKNFSNIIFDDPAAKLLYLLFDFGTDNVSLEVSYSKATNPRIWAIHSKGNNDQIFGCIDTLSISKEVRAFFQNVVPPVTNDKIAVTYYDCIYNTLHVDNYKADREIWNLKGGSKKRSRILSASGQSEHSEKAADDPFQDRDYVMGDNTP